MTILPHLEEGCATFVSFLQPQKWAVFSEFLESGVCKPQCIASQVPYRYVLEEGCVQNIISVN